MRLKRLLLLLVYLIVLNHTRSLTAQSWGNGRIAFYAQTTGTTQPGFLSSRYNELVTTFTIASALRDQPGLEFAVDLRGSSYPASEGHDARFSIYNAYVGQSFANGLLVRGGQMWLNELGALDRWEEEWPSTNTSREIISSESEVFTASNPISLRSDTCKESASTGGYFSFDGQNGASSSIGYVTLRNSGLTERSVLVFSNFVPAGNSFVVFQNAEYDVVGPAGLDLGKGLNYFFISSRYDPSQNVELQGTYHRGRSIDTRSIVDSELNGRPVDSSQLNSLLFESLDGRFTVSFARNIRAYVGYGRDRTNQGDLPLDRLNLGASTSNLLNSGLDLYLSFNHWTGSFPHDGFTFSVGKTLGKSIYISGDYTSSVSIFRITGTDGVIIENRPSSKLFGVSTVANLNRKISLQFNAQRTTGSEFNENRFLGGIAYRF